MRGALTMRERGPMMNSVWSSLCVLSIPVLTPVPEPILATEESS